MIPSKEMAKKLIDILNAPEELFSEELYKDKVHSYAQELLAESASRIRQLKTMEARHAVIRELCNRFDSTIHRVTQSKTVRTVSGYGRGFFLGLYIEAIENLISHQNATREMALLLVGDCKVLVSTLPYGDADSTIPAALNRLIEKAAGIRYKGP